MFGLIFEPLNRFILPKWICILERIAEIYDGSLSKLLFDFLIFLITFSYHKARGENQCQPLLFHHCYHILFQYWEAIHPAFNPWSQCVINGGCIIRCWMLNIVWTEAYQSCMAAIHVCSWFPLGSFETWQILKQSSFGSREIFFHLTPRGTTQQLFRMSKDNLCVFGEHTRGLHSGLSMAVSPDHSSQYQITRLVELQAETFFFPKSPGLDLSQLDSRISGSNLKPESVQLHNLRAILNAASKKYF